jgi:hypothetical protein
MTSSEPSSQRGGLAPRKNPGALTERASERNGGVSRTLALMFRNRRPSPALASLLLVAFAVVLATVAVKVTVKRLDEYASRYDAPDFAVLFDWGTRYRAGDDVWANPKIAEVRAHKYVHICNYTPAFVEAFAPLTLIDKRLAHSIWQIAQLGLLVLALTLLAREIDPPPDPATVVIFIALALMFRSVRFGIFGASSSPTLFLLLVTSWLCARRGRPAAAGLSLAIATLLKLYPGLLAVYFLLRRRWSELWWAAGFFLIGVVATGISNWLKLPMSRDFTTSAIVRWSMNNVALLPSVYAWCASFAKTGEPSWIVVIVDCMILDVGVMGVLFWATSTAANDSISDGLVFALWLNAMLLILPLAWRSELVLLFPAYLFAFTAALRASIDGHAFTRMGFIVGTILIGTCAAIELIKALPDFQPQTLTALLVFFGTSIILRNWIYASQMSGYRTTQSVGLGPPTA